MDLILISLKINLLYDIGELALSHKHSLTQQHHTPGLAGMQCQDEDYVKIEKVTMIETVTKMVKLIENYLKNVFTLCLSGGFAAVSCRSSTQKSYWCRKR